MQEGEDFYFKNKVKHYFKVKPVCSCGSESINRAGFRYGYYDNGKLAYKRQVYKCKICGRYC